MKPPTIRALLDNPAYRAMFKRVPKLPPAANYGQPWSVWALGTNGRWKGGHFATYADGWKVLVKAVRSHDIEDVSIVSRRIMFPPPVECTWDYPFNWCSRCRRPSWFGLYPRHHALRTAPVMTQDDPRRCFYCGMRRVAMPAYSG